MKKFNLNNRIHVKLTEKGIRHLINKCMENPIQFPVLNAIEGFKSNIEGHYTFQAWDFMNIFGGLMHIGMDEICENLDILFLDSDIKDI